VRYLGEDVQNKEPVVLLTRRWPEAVESALSQRYTLIRNETDIALSAEQLAVALTQADVVCPTVTDRLNADVFAGGCQSWRSG
jgi:lactate dehydrogenase-like 2-hydroxyacid dehydrogenase